MNFRFVTREAVARAGAAGVWSGRGSREASMPLLERVVPLTNTEGVYIALHLQTYIVRMRVQCVLHGYRVAEKVPMPHDDKAGRGY